MDAKPGGDVLHTPTSISGNLMASFRIRVRSETETARAASVLAAYLHEGDVVLLDGALGAGKTTFVKSVGYALNSSDEITSPTFGIAHFYDTGHGRLVHVDTYRLGSLAEFRDLGLEEYLPTSIALIEWGSIVSSDFRRALNIQIATIPGGLEDEREFVFQSDNVRWSDDLESIATELGQDL